MMLPKVGLTLLRRISSARQWLHCLTHQSGVFDPSLTGDLAFRKRLLYTAELRRRKERGDRRRTFDHVTDDLTHFSAGGASTGKHIVDELVGFADVGLTLWGLEPRAALGTPFVLGFNLPLRQWFVVLP